jgi:dihydrofolate reductase
MGNLVVTEFVTVDGVFEDPGGSEDTAMGGWQLPLMGDDESLYKLEELKHAGALLLGRRTYDGFAEAWPNMEDAGEFGELMNNIQKYVVTMSISEFKWQNSKQLGTDLVGNVKQLKKDFEKNILVEGSGELVRALLEAELVDELRLMVYPVVLGKGRRLFEESTMAKLKLVGNRTFERGTVMLTYSQIVQGKDTE